MSCFVCHGHIAPGEPAYELALGLFPPGMDIFVCEPDPPPRYAHVRCLETQEITRPMQEIMKRYEGRCVTVQFYEGPPATGTILVAGSSAFTMENGDKEISRPYTEVHEVCVAIPKEEPPPDALDEVNDDESFDVDDDVEDLDGLGDVPEEAQ